MNEPSSSSYVMDTGTLMGGWLDSRNSCDRCTGKEKPWWKVESGLDSFSASWQIPCLMGSSWVDRACCFKPLPLIICITFPDFEPELLHKHHKSIAPERATKMRHWAVGARSWPSDKDIYSRVLPSPTLQPCDLWTVKEAEHHFFLHSRVHGVMATIAAGCPGTKQSSRGHYAKSTRT